MLTVLLTTRNGSRTLPDVLANFTRLHVPSSGWRLVIVDNGSTDRTREIVTSFKTRLPLTYVLEERIGQNAARNAGLEHLDGDLVVFTDDDVFPYPDWLIRLRVAAEAHPTYSIFGGVVRPRWEATPPDWIKWVDHQIAFAVTAPSMEEGPVDLGLVFSPNMAIRAEVFESGVRFDTSIGPSGKQYAMGSETELVTRLGRLGHKGWHVQDAIVEHFIREQQMSKSWLLGRAIRFGRGRFRITQAADIASIPCWQGMPVYLFPKLLKKTIKRAIARLRFDEQATFTARWEFNYLVGNLIEARVIRRERYTQSTKD